MPGGRPKAITKALEKTVAELFFLAFTDAQVAFYTGINERTIRRARAGEFCPAIKKAEIDREIKYRQKVWDGLGNWCGTSWFLERKYPTQFAKPEIQLNLSQVTNNNVALVITAEAAGSIKNRVKTTGAEVSELFKGRKTLPGSNGHSSSPEAKPNKPPIDI